MILSIPILFKYRKQTNFFLTMLHNEYKDYPVDGKYDFVENPLHIEYCMNALSLFYLNVIDRIGWSGIQPWEHGFWKTGFSEHHVSKTFEDISLLLITRVSQIYEKMALVEAFLQILFYMVNNMERIFPKSPSFAGTWITVKQYSLLKQKILLFLYELNHVRLPCICDLRRKSMITDLRHIYIEFIEREWENDKLYSDMFTDPTLTLGKIGCFDLQNYISEFLENPSLEENTQEIKSAIEKTKKEERMKTTRVGRKIFDDSWFESLQFHHEILLLHFEIDNLFESRRFSDRLFRRDYRSLEKEELELFELYKWTTPESFVIAHNNALSKVFLRKRTL